MKRQPKDDILYSITIKKLGTGSIPTDTTKAKKDTLYYATYNCIFGGENIK